MIKKITKNKEKHQPEQKQIANITTLDLPSDDTFPGTAKKKKILSRKRSIFFVTHFKPLFLEV